MHENTREVRLARLVRKDGNQTQLYGFDLTILLQREGSSYVAIMPGLEANCPGVGETEGDAIDEFVDGFIDIVDWHIEKDSLTKFLKAHFTEVATRKEVDTIPSPSIPSTISSYMKRSPVRIASGVLPFMQPWQLPKSKEAEYAT